MARILLLMPALPYPPRQGAALRNWGIMRALHDGGHEIYALCAGGGEVQPALAERCAWLRGIAVPARPAWRRLADWLFSARADLCRRLHDRQLLAELAALLAEHRFDAAQLEGLEMSVALPALKASGLRLIYDAHNAEAALQASAARYAENPLLRAYSHSQARRLAREEARLCALADEVVAVSEADAARLRALAPGAAIRVIPNAIDVADFAGERQSPARPTLVFSGKMDYRPNQDAMLFFAREIWPAIQRQLPEARLQIVGQHPTPAVRALARGDSVQVTGAVPSLRPYLLSCSLYIAPLRMGGGTRLKLLEAMAAGCPILATPQAAAGLEVARGALALADGAADFAQQALALLADERRRVVMGRAARALARERYDWSRVAPLVRALYE